MATIILARSKNNVIGKDNCIPWKIPSDLRHFKSTTFDSTVVMGRLTYESLGSKPLPHRNNIVLSNTINGLQNGAEFLTIDEFLKKEIDGKVYIIGGTQIYNYFMNNDLVNEVIISEVNAIVEGDSYFNHDDKLSTFIHERGEIIKDDGDQYEYTIDRYSKPN